MKKVEKSKREAIAAYFAQAINKSQLEDYEGAIKAYDKVVELDPNNADAYFNRGFCKDELRQYEAAIIDFTKAIALNAGDADSYSNRGLCRMRLGQYKNAIDDFNRALQINPNSAIAYDNRGNCRDELGLHKEAIDDFNNALRLDPDNALTYSNRGLSYYHLGRYKLAISDFDKAIQLDPYNPLAYNNRAIAKVSLNQYKAALEDFSQAIRLDPQSFNAYTNRGTAKYLLNQYEAALKDYDKAIKLHPQSGFIYQQRARLKLLLHDYLGATADYVNAYRYGIKTTSLTVIQATPLSVQEPTTAMAYYIRGMAKYQLNAYVDALADFNQAIDLDDRDGHFFYQRGLTHQHLNQLDQALHDYQHAISLKQDGDEERVQELHQFIQDIQRQLQISVTSAILDEHSEEASYDSVVEPRRFIAQNNGCPNWRYGSTHTTFSALMPAFKEATLEKPYHLVPASAKGKVTPSTFNQNQKVHAESMAAHHTRLPANPTTYDNSLLNNGQWDINPYPHPETQEPVFIYRVFRDNLEVGTAHFYKYPIFCRSRDGHRHNLIQLTGVLEGIQAKINSASTTFAEVCDALPPTFLEQLSISAWQGAQHGLLRGATHSLGYALQKMNVSALATTVTKYTFYYGGVLAGQFYQHANNLSEDTSQAFTQAAFETAQIALKQATLYQISQLSQTMAAIAKQNQWKRTSTAFHFISQAVGYGIYAQDAYQQGALKAATAITTGIAVEKTIETVSKKAVDHFLTGHQQALMPKHQKPVKAPAQATPCVTEVESSEVIESMRFSFHTH